MTKYEILDLRANLGERMTSFTKFWLTVTFAVFGAAYYGGAELDIFSSVALVTFYALTSIIIAISVRMMADQMKNLEIDVAALAEAQKKEGKAQIDLQISLSSSVIRTLLILMGFTFVAFSFYLFRGSL